MLDENEFLSPYGIRALSRYHAEHPYVFNVAGQEYRVNYLPAESDTGMFGGNSNWRGPIWMPVNALLIRALMSFYLYLRRHLQNRVSDRFGQVNEPVRGGPGNRQSAQPGSFCEMGLAGGRCTEVRRNFRPIRSGKITSCSTNISTVTMARAWEPATRRAGPVSSRS